MRARSARPTASQDGSALPAPDELDYAIVRLDGTPGNDPVGAKASPNSPPRGWIGVSEKPFAFNAQAPLMVLQHPDAAPLKLALEMNGIIGLNANRTRVRYTVNTEGGSSGSPCFSTDFQLVALHHAGDPNFAAGHKPTFNQGIPFDAIVALLETAREAQRPRWCVRRDSRPEREDAKHAPPVRRTPSRLRKDFRYFRVAAHVAEPNPPKSTLPLSVSFSSMPSKVMVSA